jgi:uncharacterized membrane protein YeaQ/YmgE (transglycosylase-associated protein family)
MPSSFRSAAVTRQCRSRGTEPHTSEAKAPQPDHDIHRCLYARVHEPHLQGSFCDTRHHTTTAKVLAGFESKFATHTRVIQTWSLGEQGSASATEERSCISQMKVCWLFWWSVLLPAGWLAGKIVQGAGFGLIGDIAIGIVGAFIGDWLLPQIGIHLGSGIVSAIVNATIGAVLLLLVVRLLQGGGRFGGWGRRRWW